VAAWFQSQASPYRICGGQSGTGTCLAPTALVVPCQDHSTGWPVTVEVGFIPRPVSVGFVMDNVAVGRFLSECFFFGLSVTFHQCSISSFIHPYSMVYNLGH
jgi:hypothetical protein